MLGETWVPLPRANTADTAVGGSGSCGRASSFGTAVASAASRTRRSFVVRTALFCGRLRRLARRFALRLSLRLSLCLALAVPVRLLAELRRERARVPAFGFVADGVQRREFLPGEGRRRSSRRGAGSPVFAADAASSPPPLASASGSRGTASGAFACAVSALVMARRTEGRRALAAESKRNPDSALPRATPRFRTRADSPPRLDAGRAPLAVPIRPGATQGQLTRESPATARSARRRVRRRGRSQRVVVRSSNRPNALEDASSRQCA